MPSSMNNPIAAYLAYKFVKLLSTPFEDWEAFKLGLIDSEGKKIRNPSSQEEKNSLTIMHVLIKNLKRVLAKFPFGKVKTVQFASALLLLKEEYGEEAFDEILSAIQSNLDISISLTESAVEDGLYVIENDIYDKALVRWSNDLKPIDYILNVPVYKTKDLIHDRDVVFTTHELEL